MNDTYRPFGAIESVPLLEECRQFIQIPSVSGDEKELAEHLEQRMTELGFDRVWIDGVGNVIGEINSGRPGPRVLFAAHLDTIPVNGSEAWSVDPFEGIIADDFLYGRGAVANKAALAAMLHGMSPLSAAKDRWCGALFVAATVGKERAEGMAMLQVMQATKPDYVILGEASNGQLCHGQRGRAEIALTVVGQAVHSAQAAAGCNAASQLLTLLAEVQGQKLPVHPVLGPASLELTQLVSSPYPATATVPHTCWAILDRYFLPDETEEGVLAPLTAAAAKLEQTGAATVSVEIVDQGLECYTGLYLPGRRWFAAWLTPADHPLVTAGLAALTDNGLAAECGMYGGATDGSCSQGKLGVPTVGYGPGRQQDRHSADERVAVTAVVKAAGVYQSLAHRLLASR